MQTQTEETSIDLTDPFACAELIAAHPSGRPSAKLTDVDTGPWAQCTSCCDPGNDDESFDWPEEV